MELKLSEFIDCLRDELALARRNAQRELEKADRPMVFQLEEVRVDVEVVLKRVATGKVEASLLQVFAVGVDGERTDGRTQKVSLVLKPKLNTILGRTRKRKTIVD